MNTFGLFVFCLQACLVQNVFGVCPYAARATGGPCPYGYTRYSTAIAPAAAIAPCGNTIAPAAPFSYPGRYAEFGYPSAGGWAALYGGAARYVGAGQGNVAVAGGLPVAGTTIVAGQAPIMSPIKFGGDVAAAGAVSIAGKCACGCGAPAYIY